MPALEARQDSPVDGLEHPSGTFSLLIRSPSPEAAYKVLLLGDLQDRLVPQVEGAPILASWVRTSCAQACQQHEGPLSAALLAIAPRDPASPRSTRTSSVNALGLYQQALTGLKSQLANMQHYEQDSLALICFACLMFEVRRYLAVVALRPRRRPLTSSDLYQQIIDPGLKASRGAREHHLLSRRIYLLVERGSRRAL